MLPGIPSFPALQEYASNPAPFNDAFAAGWTRLMNADRFKGPTANECD